MTFQKTPCNSPDRDPNDWFISRDGKQYPDEDFLSEAEVRGISKSVLAIEGETAERHQERVDSALDAARADRKRQRLIARRRAKEACYQCPLRQECLRQALDRHEDHGTWGGYYEEELRELRKEIARRKRKSNTTPPE